jgi:hypothetical protein
VDQIPLQLGIGAETKGEDFVLRGDVLMAAVSRALDDGIRCPDVTLILFTGPKASMNTALSLGLGPRR